LENSVIKKDDNRDNKTIPSLLQKQVSDTSFEADYRGFKVVAILASQVPVQLIESFFFLGKPLFKHFQLYHQIFPFIQSKSVHFKVITSAKTAPHKLLMNLHITDSFLI
jgi:hypothetical protein